MRKPSAAGLIVMMAVVAATAWGAEPPAPAGDLARVVPEDAFLFAELADPKGLWADFEQSGLRDMLRVVPPLDNQLKAATMMVPQVASQIFGTPWDELVTKYVTRVGLVMTDIPGQGGPDEDAPCFLLDASTTQAALDKLIRERAGAFLAKQNPGFAFVEETHRQVTLRIAKVNPQGVAYAFVDGVLVLGNPPSVKKLIDARAQRPLLANATFQKVRQKLAAPKGVTAYLNVKRIMTELRPRLDANPEFTRKLDDVGVSSLQWVGVSSAFEGRGIRDKAFLYTGPKKVGLIRLLTALTTGSSSAALVLPKECPILLALTFRDGMELWASIVKFLEEGGHVEHLARLDEGRKTVLLQLGINFDEDFVGALGGEIFLAAGPEFIPEYAAKQRMPSFAEFPFILGARVARPEALKTTIHRFFGAQPIVGQGVERQTETYRDAEINVLKLPGSESRPAYALVGDYVLFAKNKQALQKCIDAKASGENLAAAPRFPVLLRSMPPKHNALAYVDLEAILVAAATHGVRPPEDAPAPNPGVALVRELRSVYAAMVNEEDGIRLQTYSRPGLLGILGLVWFQAAEAPRPAPPARPVAPPPKVGEF